MGAPAGVVLARLLELELAGVVEQLGGKRFRAVARPDRQRLRLDREAGREAGKTGN
jgi:hypothetical protein